ncbi:putative dUTP diphosphatase Dut [Stipitochalara longipes BDJ]|nr:putative dUTP diphosphatase Dut [Stipitochalara longipes BDJ]
MILPGRAVILQNIVRNVRSPPIQTQPCGVDLTLKRILTFTSPGSIDFSNTHRKTANTSAIPFNNPSDPDTPDTPDAGSIVVPLGSYLLEFNEIVDVPLDLMGQIFVRSSLFRSGALVHAGVMDSGYRGAVGALLQVVNPRGLRLTRDARVAQIVFHHMTEMTEGYSGVYQGNEGM